MNEISISLLPSFVNSSNIDFLNQKFSTAIEIMPHELAGPLGINYAEALTILMTMFQLQLCQLYFQVYHTCDPDIAVLSVPFQDGLPDLPFECENCQEDVLTKKDLSYEIMAITTGKVTFLV